MDKELISILMPVKNEEKHLLDCLESIQAQDIQNWELIAIDDHSSDNSSAILKSFSIADQRIKHFKNPNHGIIKALQFAYKNASGSHFTRMDADDLMSKNKLSVLRSLLSNEQATEVAIGGVKYFSDSPLGDGYLKYQAWLNQLTIQQNNFSEIYKECVIPSPCWMMSRKNLALCGAFDADLYPEDYDLAFRMYEAQFLIKGTHQTLHHWRDYPSRSSRTDPNYADNRFLDLKVSHFLKIDYRSNRTLILWGAGKKSKIIAKKFIEKGIQFDWVCNNPNKIDKDIYGIILKDSKSYLSLLHGKYQIVLTVANPDEQIAILQEIKAKQSKSRELKAYLFC